MKHPVAQIDIYRCVSILSGSILAILAASSVHAAAPALQTILTFTGTGGADPGEGPLASLTLSGGTLYGTTELGGSKNDGTIFEINTSTLTLTRSISFTSTTGTEPAGDLTPIGGGNFIGTTSAGGSKNDGTVFEFNGTTNTISTLVTFTGTTAPTNSSTARGSVPVASLIVGSDGNYYGTTASGGGNTNAGTIFEINGSTGAATTLVTFSGINGSIPGANPSGDLIEVGNVFYGTTETGGNASSAGTVFSLSGTTLTPLNFFNGANGFDADSALIDVGGNFYGTTLGLGSSPGGNGSIFEINGTTGEFTDLSEFPLTGTGPNEPNGALTYYNGLFYGTSEAGGTSGLGTVYTYNPLTGDINTLISFTGASGGEGAVPFGALLSDGLGNFYGTTEYTTTTTGRRGVSLSGDGTVFKFTITPEPSPVAVYGVGSILLGLLVIPTRRRLAKHSN